MISSLVTFDPNCAEILPRRMTMIRWAMLRHSATSEVENTTARPRAARSAEQAEHLGLGADVDAAAGFVEQDDFAAASSASCR